MRQPPIVAATLGDPCGIGPEVVVKALAAGDIGARPVVIGDAWIVERTIALVKASLAVNRIGALEQARFARGRIDVLDTNSLRAEDVTIGKVSSACGHAVTAWWDIACDWAQRGLVGAIVKGPVNSEAIRAAGGAAAAAVEPGKTYLLLITGPLRVAHLTDHIPLHQVLTAVTADAILKLLRLLHASLRQWGVKAPRIGVAGLNPHAHGAEEDNEIVPAIAQARRDGIDAAGPVPPDSLFRLCVEGRYDCVVAHYHDQGHIAVKTWGFRGNCALILGAPYIRLSVAHGTAFDIAGRGVADAASMSEALRTAAALAGGQGFPPTMEQGTPTDALVK